MNGKMRYEQVPLSKSDRPTMLYEYYVTGKGLFPYDMLRYDQAWPASAYDANLLSNFDTQRSIKMQSHRQPTVGRWESFGWSPGTDRL